MLFCGHPWFVCCSLLISLWSSPCTIFVDRSLCVHYFGGEKNIEMFWLYFSGFNLAFDLTPLFTLLFILYFLNYFFNVVTFELAAIPSFLLRNFPLFKGTTNSLRNSQFFFLFLCNCHLLHLPINYTLQFTVSGIIWTCYKIN